MSLSGLQSDTNNSERNYNCDDSDIMNGGISFNVKVSPLMKDFILCFYLIYSLCLFL